jgi:hypothetical protein
MPGHPPLSRPSAWRRIGLLAGFAALVVACLQTQSTSRPVTEPVAVAQPAKPTSLHVQGAVLDKDKVRVAVGLPNASGEKLAGTLHVELVDRDGQSLGTADTLVRQFSKMRTYGVEFAAPKVATDQLKLRGSFGQQQFDVALRSVLLPKGHETDLAASQEFHPGSTAALRCDVHGVKSLTETVPLADADVEVRLIAPKDGHAFPLAHEKTGGDGTVAAEFKVPSVPPGQYTLEVSTHSALGDEKLTRDVQVKAGTKVLLTTDKPLYQPGQLIHLRALALHPFDLTPVGNAALVFEVEDPKGNKVFKRTQKTSEFGVAAIDFQLADEVNMGDYHVRAILGEYQADKSVAIQRYVLPKFKSALKTDKTYYLPKETIHAELQSDYFFGKPVAESKVVVTASTFDVRFTDFQTWEGKTDANGHAKFEIKLPDSFVGQPLQKGNALVKLEVKVTDTADHTETLTKTYPVSDQPIKVSLIPEGGRLVANLENRVFAAAIYPDGAPAACDVSLWLGQQANGKPFATVRTNEAGLAEFRITPKPQQFRQVGWEQRQVEMLGRTQTTGGPKQVLDLFAEAKDREGNAARAHSEVNTDPFGENVLLRLDKAIYKAGDTMNVDVRSSAGLPTVFLDVIKGGQTMLTTWLDVKDGKAARGVELPTTAFGTMEVHAYQMLAGGEILRDSRVVYVQPRGDLKIEVKPDQSEYLPGGRGVIRFQVTDAAGKPTVAALGVIIVDEAVYALQDLQPGLEKVYFTLQEELIKPQAQVVYQPNESINQLVREPVLPADKQQVAEVLLTSVKPKPPVRWVVAPEVARREKAETQIMQLGQALYFYAQSGQPFQQYDRDARRWRFRPSLLKDLEKSGRLPQPIPPPGQPARAENSLLTDPFGRPFTIEDLPRLDSGFTPENLARAVTWNRMQNLHWWIINYTNQNRGKYFQGGKWDLPNEVLEEAVKAARLDTSWITDGWGKRLLIVQNAKKLANPTGQPQFEHHELVSAGPDGKLDTADDLHSSDPKLWQHGGWWWWVSDPARMPQLAWRGNRGLNGNMFMLQRDGGMPMGGGFGGGGGLGMPLPAAAPAPRDAARMMRPEKAAAKADRPMAAEGKGKGGGPGQDKAAGPPTRVREYFPETMLWDPALITDDKGVATLPVSFADSITTWRLSASASSRGGLLGGVSSPLRVFQEFFVDLDLPVALTQNDEVAFPVAVYNYLKTPQTVKLELQREDWFDLADENGFVRSLDLKPGEVTSAKFRIRAKKIGSYPLTVHATGSKRSDAVKRFIEIVPNGKRIEQVVTDRLTGNVSQTITFPDYALPDSTKLVVKVYPGVMSQVLEGTEGMLRLPGG